MKEIRICKQNLVKKDRKLLFNYKNRNTLFHLGGDPTGTGKGGVSIYGECFDDEVHDDLKHTGKFISFIFIF